jgi:hypothetical protein
MPFWARVMLAYAQYGLAHDMHEFRDGAYVTDGWMD